MKLVFTFLFLLAPIQVNASIILDQQNPLLDDPYFASFCGVSSCAEWQQGVTVGVEGILAGLDIFTAGLATGTLSIWNDTPWQSEVPVYSASYIASGITYIDLLPANIYLSVGDTFTFGLSGGTDVLGGGPVGSYNTAFSSGNYAGGELWNNNYPNCFGDTGDGNCAYDLAFNSYISVPEPASITLLCLGVVGIGFVRRMRKI